MIVDHEDGDKTNNLITNLRVIPAPVNTRNSKMYACNTSGTVGVYYSKERPDRNISDAWSAGWYDMNGKLKTKSFSIRKYGEVCAREMATQYRKEQIDLLNELGAGYTERHGERST